MEVCDVPDGGAGAAVGQRGAEAADGAGAAGHGEEHGGAAALHAEVLAELDGGEPGGGSGTGGGGEAVCLKGGEGALDVCQGVEDGGGINELEGGGGHGKWEVGSWKLEVGSWKLEVGSWKLEVGGWRLEVGSWKLEVGSWKLEVGSWKLEVGGWRLEVGGWKLEVGSWKLEVGSWKLEVGSWRGLVAGADGGGEGEVYFCGGEELLHDGALGAECCGVFHDVAGELGGDVVDAGGAGEFELLGDVEAVEEFHAGVGGEFGQFFLVLFGVAGGVKMEADGG